jgi:transcription elongation factor Elf1
MGTPAAVLIAINYSDIKSLVKQQCPKCGNVMATIRSRIVAAKRYRRFECRSCGHRLSLGGDNADQPIDRYSRNPDPATRRFDAATIKAIRESLDGRRVLAKQYGCSETMIQDIVAMANFIATCCLKDLEHHQVRVTQAVSSANSTLRLSQSR